MRLKKIISLGIAVIMATSVLVGCGNTENKESTASNVESQKEDTQKDESASSTVNLSEESNEITFPLEETMEFTGYSVMAGTLYYADNRAWNYMLERGNIQIELTEVSKSDVQEKGKLLLNSGDYPDLLFKPIFSLDTYGMEGVLIPLEDLIREYAPNLTALLDEKDGWSAITSADGHVYSLPYIDELAKPGFGKSGPIWINQRWLDNLGLKMPTNKEELYSVLKAFKEKDANGNGNPDDEIPFSYSGGTHDMVTTFSLLMENVLIYNEYCALVDGEFVYYPLTDEFKEYAAFFAQLYEEGLLDNNAITYTTDQYNAMALSGDVLGMFQATSTSIIPEEYRQDYVVMQSYNDGGYPTNSGVTKGAFAITDKCENPEILVAWMDYLYTEEGSKLVRLGIEGECYTVNEKGQYSFVEDYNTYESALIGGGVTPGYTSSYIYSGVNSEESPYDAYDNAQLLTLNGTILPSLLYTEEESEIKTTLQTDIKGYVKNYFAQVVSGQLDLDASWNDFQATLKKMGVEELAAIYKSAYERGSAM